MRPGAPVHLCEHHLALAHDWYADGDGVVDRLPGPCALCGSQLGVRLGSGWTCAVCEWRVGDSPDGELERVRIDVVYYLGFRDRVKIGTTARPRQRMAAIWHDDVLAFERGNRMVEHRRHEQFSADRLKRSEWFSMSDALDQHIRVVRAAGEPWDLYARWVAEAQALQ